MSNEAEVYLLSPENMFWVLNHNKRYIHSHASYCKILMFVYFFLLLVCTLCCCLINIIQWNIFHMYYNILTFIPWPTYCETLYCKVQAYIKILSGLHPSLKVFFPFVSWCISMFLQSVEKKPMANSGKSAYVFPKWLFITFW